MLWMDINCPTFDKLYDEVMKSEEVQKINKENEVFFKFLESKTGLVSFVLNMSWNIADPLTCEVRWWCAE